TALRPLHASPLPLPFEADVKGTRRCPFFVAVSVLIFCRFPADVSLSLRAMGRYRSLPYSSGFVRMYTQILNFVLCSALLLTASRIALMVWQRDRVVSVNGVGPILLGGLRIDALLIALAVAPLLLVAPWLAGSDDAADVSGAWLVAAWALI